jgi:predicted alpha/beta hydrolase family esterase
MLVLFIHGAGAGAHAEDRLLGDSLRLELGGGYDVQCPQMPDEENVPVSLWIAEIDAKIAGASGAVALVGHSAGGSVLLKYVCERRHALRIAGLYLIAAPYCSADEGWQWNDATPPADAAAKLAGDWPLIFYHSRDDEIVPFAHLAMHAARVPRATVRAFDGRGHQFNNDLREVADDVRRD